MYYSLLLHTKLSFSIRPRKAFSNFEGPQRVIGIYLELGLLEIKVIVYKSCGELFLLMQCTTKFIRPKHGRQKVHDYFYYCSVNHQSGLQSNTFSKLLHNIFNTSKCATNYVISFEVYDGFIGQKILKL